VRFERDMPAQPGGNSRQESPPPFLNSGSAQASDDPQVWG
jgi:hypothetical protein